MSDDEEQRHSDVEEEEDHSDAERERQEEEDRRREEEEARRAEAAAERQKKQEEKKKKEEQEASKKRKPGQKRKGLGGLSPEKKRLLKQLIMQKAADEMKAETKKRQEEKENYLKAKVKPLELDGLNDGQLESKCKELYEILKAIESDKYDWEEKIRRQDFEINELTIKVNDVKGKFVKPVLKKVSKTDMTMARLDKKTHSTLGSLKTQLKSTGQNKFAIEEKNETEKADWRNELKAKEDEPEA